GDALQRRHAAGERDDWAEGAAVVVDLRLRQVERVFALDVAGAHVVADGVADDLEPRRQYQRDLRLRHRPAAVVTNPHALAGADYAIGGRLEEEFRPFRRVHQVVKLGGAGGLALARLAAALVGDAGGPHLLAVDRRQQRHVVQRQPAQVLVDQVVSHGGGVVGMEDVAEGVKAGVVFQIEEVHVAVGEDAHADLSGFQLDLAQLHRQPRFGEAPLSAPRTGPADQEAAGVVGG